MTKLEKNKTIQKGIINEVRGEKIKQTGNRPEEEICKTHNQQRICIQNILTKQNKTPTHQSKITQQSSRKVNIEYEQKTHRNGNLSAQ